MPEGVSSHDCLVLGGAHGLQDPDPLLRHRLGVLKHGEERGVGRLAAVRRGERVDQQLEVRVHRRVRISLQHLATSSQPNYIEALNRTDDFDGPLAC